MMKDQTLAYRPLCDEDGFSLPEVAWNEDLAIAMASEDHLPKLSDQQLQFLHTLRNYYDHFRFVPLERYACRATALADDCVQDLFQGNMREAWRLAGLPNPGEEANTYMSSRSRDQAIRP
ncbi:MAG: TusE/DsrC/DsvC family sulfur relay protein [Magnetococcales bacterium]|nr:TusE/DsrC/DsvC family sulfur relay protein [Magnetococcales bacterium]